MHIGHLVSPEKLLRYGTYPKQELTRRHLYRSTNYSILGALLRGAAALEPPSIISCISLSLPLFSYYILFIILISDHTFKEKAKCAYFFFHPKYMYVFLLENCLPNSITKPLAPAGSFFRGRGRGSEVHQGRACKGGRRVGGPGGVAEPPHPGRQSFQNF